MPPIGGGGIFAMIASDGLQDRWLSSTDLLNDRLQYIIRNRGAYTCGCCARKTDIEPEYPKAPILCVACRMTIVRLVLRARGKFKRDFPHAEIMLLNRYSIGTEIKIGAYDPDESTATAREIVDRMGFKYNGDVIHHHSRAIQLITVGEPVAHRNKFGDGEPYTYVTTIQLDAKIAYKFANHHIPNKSTMGGLRAIAMRAACGSHTLGSHIECLPDELLEPILLQMPVLSVRFLMP
ncbi:hypothetical protein F-M6_0292 [Faustovirus]|nr:hypothetical protein F-M6_0292 [Faustovirus]